MKFKEFVNNIIDLCNNNHVALMILGIIIGVFLILDIVLIVLLCKKNQPVATNDQVVINNYNFINGETQEEQNVDVADENDYTIDTMTGSVIRLNKSFRAKLHQLPKETQEFYSTLKNHYLGYKKVKARESFKFDSINYGREKLAKFVIRGKSLFVYLSLTNDEIEQTRITKISESATYSEVKSFVKVTGRITLNRAIKAFDLVCARLNIPFVKEGEEKYFYPFRTNKYLIEQGLIKPVNVKDRVTIEDAQAKVLDHVAVGLMDEETHDNVVKHTEDVFVDTLSKNFKDDDVVDLNALKEKGLVKEKTDSIKIIERGSLNKKLNVIANDFTNDAAKMILLAGGTIKKLVPTED